MDEKGYRTAPETAVGGDAPDDGYQYSPEPKGGEFGDSAPTKASVPRRIIDSFKRDPNAHTTPKGAIRADGRVFDAENAAAATAESPLARKLKGRHLQMIAIGGSIGVFGRASLHNI